MEHTEPVGGLGRGWRRAPLNRVRPAGARSWFRPQRFVPSRNSGMAFCRTDLRDPPCFVAWHRPCYMTWHGEAQVAWVPKVKEEIRCSTRSSGTQNGSCSSESWSTRLAFPCRATPWLLAAGALAASGQVSLVALVAGGRWRRTVCGPRPVRSRAVARRCGAGSPPSSPSPAARHGRSGGASIPDPPPRLRVGRAVPARIESNRGEPVGRHGSGAAALRPPRDRQLAELTWGWGHGSAADSSWLGPSPRVPMPASALRGWPDRARSGGGRRRCARVPGMASATPGSP